MDIDTAALRAALDAQRDYYRLIGKVNATIQKVLDVLQEESAMYYFEWSEAIQHGGDIILGEDERGIFAMAGFDEEDGFFELPDWALAGDTERALAEAKAERQRRKEEARRFKVRTGAMAKAGDKG